MPRVSAAAAQSYARSPGEVAAGVVPQIDSFPVGDVRRHGMSSTAAPADNSKALQDCLNASAGANAVRVPAGDGPYRLQGRITAPAGTSIKLERGARLQWESTDGTGSAFLRATTRPGLEVLGDNFQLTGEGQIVGPSAGTYVAREIGLLSVGASARSLRSGFSIADGVEFMHWGSHAIAVQFTRGITVRNIKVHDCGYAGIQFLSCQNGTVVSSEVGDIVPGTSGNAYGISCTHDSLGYASDPNAVSDPRSVVNPFCAEMTVESNLVHDIPLWTGIDFHGARNCRAEKNKVYNCRNGVLMQGSSGEAVDFAGEQNSVIGNLVTTRRMNGEATTIQTPTRLGISVNGGHRIRHRAVTVRDNSIDGYGDVKHSSSSLQHTNTSEIEISSNKITNWLGYGLYSAYSDGVISGNEFGSIADATSSACIFVAIGGALRITGNRQVDGGGHPAMYGIYINTPTDPPYVIRDNDFHTATVQAYAGHSGSRLSPSQMRTGAQ